MQQRTLIALAALVVFGGLAFFTLRAPQKGEHKGPKPRPVAAIKSADVKQLEVTADGGKIKLTMKLDGATWKITSPGTWTADQSLVHAMLDQLEKMGFGDVVSENPSKHADLEVSGDKGAHVIARNAGGQALVDGWFGKSVSGFTMFRPEGKNEVWQATGVFKYTFARDAATMRDHSVLELAKDDVGKLTVEGDGGKLVLEKQPSTEKNAPAKWKVVESTVKVEPLDAATANNMIQTMSTLRAGAFADDAKPADVGLAPAKYTLTADVKGQPKTLLLGNTKGDETYAEVAGQPQVYVLPKYTVERLAVAPINFRDKTVVKAKADDIAAVEVQMGGETMTLTHDGAAWKLGKGGPVDEAKVKMLVGAFDNLQASGFAVGVTPAAAGLAKPTTSVTLRLKDKSQVVLKIGALKDMDYYVQKVGSPDILLLKKYLVERVLKKPADLGKAASAAK